MAQKQIDTTLTNLEVWIGKTPTRVRLIPNEEMIIPSDVEELSDAEYDIYSEIEEYYNN